MPKEYTYADTIPYGEDDPGRSVVEVSWSREAEHVQLATRCMNQSTEGSWRPPWINELISEDQPVPTHVFAQDGWYIDLDRNAINKLIRDLRRARDQAFGRDE
jgi:hypothetical protein